MIFLKLKGIEEQMTSFSRMLDLQSKYAFRYRFARVCVCLRAMNCFPMHISMMQHVRQPTTEKHLVYTKSVKQNKNQNEAVKIIFIRSTRGTNL